MRFGRAPKLTVDQGDVGRRLVEDGASGRDAADLAASIAGNPASELAGARLRPQL